MANKILIVSGSPKKEGNTASLIQWFAEGASSKGAELETVMAAFLKYKTNGCLGCRKCQSSEKFECAVDDDARPVLAKIAASDVLVMATPLYFFGASAQLKMIFDRMFSLYKWDNAAGTYKSPLLGKTMVLLASAYEDVGLEALEKPFALTAAYTKMKFHSLLVKNAGVSGDLAKQTDVRARAVELGKKVAAR